ncbi:hypothetical protein CDAR_19961 [Caerostris darwini]|uniref:Uncharacterized protein n=1 Tax=Caerostris darwini TaxID=1538125 RepID=A0AAV4PV64_9ARAC|nr:hypothetical protein CDAR_19961 [Caerostris darwini]
MPSSEVFSVSSLTEKRFFIPPFRVLYMRKRSNFPPEYSVGYWKQRRRAERFGMEVRSPQSQRRLDHILQIILWAIGSSGGGPSDLGWKSSITETFRSYSSNVRIWSLFLQGEIVFGESLEIEISESLCRWIDSTGRTARRVPMKIYYTEVIRENEKQQTGRGSKKSKDKKYKLKHQNRTGRRKCPLESKKG